MLFKFRYEVICIHIDIYIIYACFMNVDAYMVHSLFGVMFHKKGIGLHCLHSPVYLEHFHGKVVMTSDSIEAINLSFQPLIRTI